MTKLYLAFDIGCIECGEDSNVIGLFKTREAAESAIKNYLNEGEYWGKKGRRGQHYEEIFEIEQND